MPAALRLDPFALDRALVLGVKRHASFNEVLYRGDDAADHAFELLPQGLDEELLRALRERSLDVESASAHWLTWLLAEHSAIDLRRAEARALRREPHAVHDTREPFTIAEIASRVLSDGSRRTLWLTELGRVAPSLASRRFELWDHLAERYGALGVTPVPLGENAARWTEAARDFLSATDDAWSSFGVDSLARAVELGLGADVPGDWPARLGSRVLGELFREGGWFAGVAPELGAMPSVLGASSVLRALDLFGRAWHDAAGSRSRPFALTHEPRGERRATYGALSALLPSLPAFARTRLDVSRPSWPDYARGISRVLLFGARFAALRSLLAASAYSGPAAYRDAWADGTSRTFAFELPLSYAGALFVQEDALSAFAGLLSAAPRIDALVDRHDEDWFRNPKAIEELRHESDANPVPLGVLDLPIRVKSLTRLVASGLGRA